MLTQHTKETKINKNIHRGRLSSTSLLEPPLTSEKVTKFLVSSLETKSPAPSSKTLLIALFIYTYLPPVESSNSLTIHSHLLLILHTNESFYSLLTIYS